MNFKQAVDDVIAITARPDKVQEAIAALNQALSTFTMKADFAKDLVEQTITIDPTLYGDTIPLDTLVRFRKIKYLKPTGALRYLMPIGSDKLFTNSALQPDGFYIGGNNLTYTLSNLAPSLEIGYYQYPAILANDVFNTHWMLDIMYQAVVDTAAARVFKLVGDEISHKIYQQMGMDAFVTVRSDMQDSVVAYSK